jgi:DNA polymerase III psi subunit
MTNEIAEVLFTEELYHIQGKTIVVSSDPWDKVSEGSRALLQKILQAVGLSIESVTIIHQASLDVTRIAGPPSRVIFFGIAEGRNSYEPFSLGPAQVISAPPLDQLLNDSSAKQKLWAGLKALFSR